MRALVLALAVLAGPALAQEEPSKSVTTDLDGDGRLETYTLIESGTETVDLMVDDGTGWATARHVAWDGGSPGQRASLALNEAGSVVIESGNDAIGRDRWHLLVTLAHRDGDIRIAGLTYDRYDTLEPETGWRQCDLNLLSGRGAMDGPDGPSAFDAPGAAPVLWDWKESRLPEVLPVECFG